MHTFKRNAIAIALLGFAGSAAIAQTTQPQTQPGAAPAQTQRQPTASPGMTTPPSATTSPGASSRADSSAPIPTFQSLDRDRDGSISRAEAGADQQLASQFGQLDRNGDGKLDASEFPGSSK